jgi:hypothetical protein
MSGGAHDQILNSLLSENYFGGTRQRSEALYYKPEGRGFETRLGERTFSIYLFPFGPGVYSASNRNEYQKQKICVSGE